jgi:uncharacterized protein YbjQ (UPF0145 family)
MFLGMDKFLIVTTPTVAGFKITKVLGVVTAITPRTRGIGGKIVAGIQSAFGGEVTAFTTELEKARVETLRRIEEKGREIGANAVVGLDMETTDLGLQTGVVAISAIGTAVMTEPV